MADNINVITDDQGSTKTDVTLSMMCQTFTSGIESILKEADRLSWQNEEYSPQSSSYVENSKDNSTSCVTMDNDYSVNQNGSSTSKEASCSFEHYELRAVKEIKDDTNMEIGYPISHSVSSSNNQARSAMQYDRDLKIRCDKSFKSFLSNFEDVTSILDNELDFVKWYRFSYAPVKQKCLDLYFRQKTDMVEQQLNETKQSFLLKTSKWNANHKDILPPILDTKLKLASILPYRKGDNTVDIILRVKDQPCTFVRLLLLGIQNKFILEMKEFQSQYIIHPQLEMIKGIRGKFRALALVKYTGANQVQMFVLCRIGKVYIFIELDSSVEFFYLTN